MKTKTTKMSGEKVKALTPDLSAVMVEGTAEYRTDDGWVGIREGKQGVFEWPPHRVVFEQD